MSLKKRKPAKITDEDLNLFHEAMKGIKPLACDKKLLQKDTAKPLPHCHKSKAIPTTPLTLDLPPVTSNEYISFKQPGISDKTLRKLRKGKYNMDAVLDLHGMTVAKANIAINTFLQQCILREMRTVLIIHGKGSHGCAPILKNEINHWLRAFDLVLAFCTASPQHGGSGAIYVLLKNQKGKLLE